MQTCEAGSGMKQPTYTGDAGIPGLLTRTALAVTFFYATLFAGDAGTRRKVSTDLLDRSASDSVAVIVQFDGIPTATDVAAIAAGRARIRQIYRHVPAASLTVPASAIAGIAANPHVTYVSKDRELSGRLEFAVPAVGADIANSNGWTGDGVGIAILDSGVSAEHPDLKGRITHSENFVPNESTSDDLYGHGTHVAIAAAGNAAASMGNSYTISFRG